jgi:predicted Zn-dependent peptidase
MFFHRPDQALLVVVGDFTLDAVKTQAERWFGDWRPTPTHLRRQASLPRRQLDVPEKDRILLAQRPGATQTTVQMGCLLPQMTPDKQALYDVFAAFVGGDLFEELRWKIGATYNVGGGVSVAWDGTTKLEARTDIETARLQEALEILLRRWRRAPIAGSFNRLRWDAGRSFATRFTTSSDFAQAIFEAWIRRWPIAILDDYPKQLSRLSPSELEPLIRSCRDTTAIALIGDKAIAWAAYQAANRALEAPEPQPPKP